MNKKITYLEYYTVSIKNEENDTFLVELFATEKKPKEWKNVELNIFDSWHDDLVYNTNFESNYLWVRLKSKYGIGSITFIPENFDEKNKDYVIVYDYVSEKEFKPVIGVFVHPNTQERIDKTKKHLESLRRTNIPIYLCSNMGCPDELINLCDGYIYTGPNELCNVPEDIEDKRKYLEYSIKNPITIYPEEFRFYQNHYFINGLGTYLWSAAKCLKISIEYLETNGYSHIMISEGEFILDKLDSEKPQQILKDMWENEVVLDFFHTHGSRYLQAYLWFGNIKHLNEVFKDITKEDKHYPKNNSNVNAFVLCEKYYQNKLLTHNNSKKIRVRTINDNVVNILNRYWYTNRTELISYERNDFKTDDYGLDELLSFPLYFPNTKEVFLSIANKNIKTDNLSKNSFDLGISEINETDSVLVVKNNTNTQILNFKLTIINNFNELVLVKTINECTPDLWFFSTFKTPIDKNYKCDYIISLTDSNIIIYQGQFN
jgi:phage regulator Rha-like protein